VRGLEVFRADGVLRRVARPSEYAKRVHAMLGATDAVHLREARSDVMRRARSPDPRVSPAILLLVRRRVKRRKGFTRLSAKRQITLPLAVVERAGIKFGEELAVEADEHGRVIVSRAAGDTIGDRRRRALDRAAGALPGVWPAGALDELRDEWR
jgi:bifunctional DNA-binding transcriptional regulator/antitoxin component of YhaV-PrlF toxin-antitoxin module